MKITPIGELERKPRQVAIGSFDGVHLGHQAVIKGSDTVLTFDPHPLSVIHPESAPKLLTTVEGKAERAAKLGVEELAVITFDEQFAKLTAEQFVEDILIEKLQAQRVSVGSNFRFGNRAAGDTEFLRRYNEFETNVVSLVELDDETVSSSHIRALIQAGDVDKAAEFLGTPFTLKGLVVHGDKRGRELGFPTANIVPDGHFACPGHGVYACFANGHPAAVNVGIRPTFETGRGLLIEAFLIDFSGDLYDKPLELQFLSKLRGEHAFESVEQLVAAMQQDVERSRGICAKSATVLR